MKEESMKLMECQYSEANLMLDVIAQYAKSAIQSVIIINGMAIISILTFIGNTIERGFVYNKWLIGFTIFCFCVGIIGGMLGYCFAYLSQQIFRRIYENNNSADEKGVLYRNIGFGVVIASIVFFFIGCILGVFSIIP